HPCARRARRALLHPHQGGDLALAVQWAGRRRPRLPGAGTGPVVTRYGAMYGPDITFLGVDRCDLTERSSFDGADVVIVGAPFDGGPSYRSGARFGPAAIRSACYLAHDGSRPSLALRTDGLRDLRVVAAGDVEIFSGDIEPSLAALRAAVAAVAAAGAIPVVLG